MDRASVPHTTSLSQFPMIQHRDLLDQVYFWMVLCNLLVMFQGNLVNLQTTKEISYVAKEHSEERVFGHKSIEL